MNKNLYSIGLMSGTSLDGIDVSIIKSDGDQFIEVIDNIYLKYGKKLRSKLKKIVNLCSSKNQFKKNYNNIAKIQKSLTLQHYKACKKICKKNKKIKINLIGFPGQTIVHNPKKKYSIQIGDGKLLSKLTNTTVVTNFRQNDILNGGQGAPLTPLYHKLIAKKIKLQLPVLIVNIGGISNITFIGKKEKLISFDTGPGNFLIDKLISTKSKFSFDKGGELATSGTVDKDKLNFYLNNPYYKKLFPKSLDVKYFKLKYIKNIRLEDELATLSMLTVKSICLGVKSLKKKINRILICGGGRKNKFIIKNIKKEIKFKVNLIDDFNFNGDFIESQAFAYLAIRSYDKKYISMPSTTGVKKKCSGGTIHKV